MNVTFRRMCFCLFALFIALLPVAAFGNELLVFPDGPKVGDKAPPLHLAKLLNAPTNAATTWQALQGKVVVLDFWATWCPPCVASIPHMNQLADELKDEPVQFIAITAQPEEVVTKFLKKNPLEKENISEWPKDQRALAESVVKTFQQANPIHAWIGLDDLTGQDADDYYAGSTVTGYFFHGVPHCVVVDRNGVIAAYLQPMQVNAAFLRAIAKGEHPAIPDPDIPPAAIKEWKEEEERRKQWPRQGPRGATMEVSIRRSREWVAEPAAKSEVFVIPNPLSHNLSFQKSGVSLEQALKEAGALSPLNRGGVPLMKFDVLSPLPRAPHDFNFSVPEEAFPDIFGQAIQTAFDLDIRKETQSEEAFHLKKVSTVKQARKQPLTVKDRVQDREHGRIAYASDGQGSAMSFLRTFVRDYSGKGVIYDNQSPSLDVEVTWDPAGGFEAFKKALREQMGLDLVPEKFSVQVFHVQSRKKG